MGSSQPLGDLDQVAGIEGDDNGAAGRFVKRRASGKALAEQHGGAGLSKRRPYDEHGAGNRKVGLEQLVTGRID